MLAHPSLHPSFSNFFFHADPEQWGPEDIRQWVSWCSREFKFPKRPDLARFPTSGTALCGLSKYDLIELSMDYKTGKTLYSYLSYLKAGREVGGRPSCEQHMDEDDGKSA